VNVEKYVTCTNLIDQQYVVLIGAQLGAQVFVLFC
jgi:hypothetical protein